MLFVSDVSATSNESFVARPSPNVVNRGGSSLISCEAPSPSPFCPHRLLTLNGLFRNISRGISFEPLFVLPLPLLPSFSAISLCRNLVKTVSDWVDRRLSISLSSNWFLPVRPTHVPRPLFTNPVESPRSLRRARGLVCFKVVFAWAYKETHE